jgi:putative ABC transport system ATP-binding protein
MDILKELAHNDGKCVIIVTRSPELAEQADTMYKI